MSEAKRGIMIGFLEDCLNYCEISGPISNAATTVMRVWNKWIEDGCMQRRAVL